MRHHGLVEAADNCYVSESATSHLKMAGIDNEWEFLKLERLKIKMIFGLRSTKTSLRDRFADKTSLRDQLANQLWTAQ